VILTATLHSVGVRDEIEKRGLLGIHESPIAKLNKLNGELSMQIYCFLFSTRRDPWMVHFHPYVVSGLRMSPVRVSVDLHWVELKK
jgi:hypothetical protein